MQYCSLEEAYNFSYNEDELEIEPQEEVVQPRPQPQQIQTQQIQPQPRETGCKKCKLRRDSNLLTLIFGLTILWILLKK